MNAQSLIALLAGVLVSALLSLFIPPAWILAATALLSPLVFFLVAIQKNSKNEHHPGTSTNAIKQAVSKERERIYRNLHDDLGAQLLNMVYQAPDHRTADQAREILSTLREDIARTLDKKLTLLELLGELRAEMEERLNSSQIQLEWQIPPDMPDTPILIDNVIPISRLLREAISNVIRHSKADHLRLSTVINKNDVRVTLLDNGIGMAENVKFGRGINSMHTRASEIGAELILENISAGQQSGCRLSLVIPR